MKPVLVRIEMWWPNGMHRLPGSGTLTRSLAFLLAAYEESKGVRW